eukprot:Seg144.2 transcript_id=Seg144.2/GoldUCD/mRNA.D3Y31 product=Tenascin-R protein_id=Seg144.2/GoldUCD/D3Y31
MILFLQVGKICQKLKPCPADESCVDSCHCPGYQCILTDARRYENCQDAHKRGLQTNKDYIIQPHPNSVFPVPCDMTTNGGGWIIFQRRVSGSVDFFRTWTEYKNGFGDLNGNFWLGLDKLHLLAGPGKGATLRVDLRHMDWPYMIYAEYNTFEIANEADGYRLKVKGYSGNATDSLDQKHDGRMFSTKDKNSNCADRHKGGWWYGNCHRANLNGLYPSDDQMLPQYMSWHNFKYTFGRVTFSEMKLKYK